MSDQPTLTDDHTTRLPDSSKTTHNIPEFNREAAGLKIPAYIINGQIPQASDDSTLPDWDLSCFTNKPNVPTKRGQEDMSAQEANNTAVIQD